MVRVAGLKGQVAASVASFSQEGMSPRQQLDAISEEAGGLMLRQQEQWSVVIEDLRDAGISLVKADQLAAREKTWLDGWFLEQIFPALTPLAVDPAHPFPFIPNMAGRFSFGGQVP